MPVDFESDQNEILLNPRYSTEERKQIFSLLDGSPPLKAHLWLSTSGSSAECSGRIKWAALSKEAILASAQAVNLFLQCCTKDIWAVPLPPFHVGGLGIWARSYLSKAKVIDAYSIMHGLWNPLHFAAILMEHSVTLTSLVPAQVYDLALHHIAAPASLRAVIVGGGALQESIYRQCIGLGWNLLPSYGLTECSSQVATAELDSWKASSFPELKLLPHITAAIDSGLIMIKSPSLLSYYALKSNEGVKFIDPKKNGWFCTEDLGTLSGPFLKVQGRRGSLIKIGGESVNLESLQKILDEIKLESSVEIDMALFPMPDERLGFIIHLAAVSDERHLTQSIVSRYQEKVLPFERIRQVHYLPSIPRTALSKIMPHELLKLVCK